MEVVVALAKNPPPPPLDLRRSEVEAEVGKLIVGCCCGLAPTDVLLWLAPSEVDVIPLPKNPLTEPVGLLLIASPAPPGELLEYEIASSLIVLFLPPNPTAPRTLSTQ